MSCARPSPRLFLGSVVRTMKHTLAVGEMKPSQGGGRAVTDAGQPPVGATSFAVRVRRYAVNASIREGLDKVLCGGTKVRAADRCLPWEGGRTYESACGTCTAEAAVVGCAAWSAHDTVRGAGLGILCVPPTRVGRIEPTICTSD